jgi:hypothetical protein
MNSCVANLSIAAPRPRAGAISATLVSLKSAELFYEPGELTLTRQNNRCGFKLCCDGRRSGAALRRGSAPAHRPILATEE